VQASVLDLFEELQREWAFACLFISHDLAVVDRLADDVAVLRDGVLQEMGPRDEILRNPQTEYTQRLVAGARTRSRRAAPQARGQRRAVRLNPRRLSATFLATKPIPRPLLLVHSAYPSDDGQQHPADRHRLGTRRKGSRSSSKRSPPADHFATTDSHARWSKSSAGCSAPSPPTRAADYHRDESDEHPRGAERLKVPTFEHLDFSCAASELRGYSAEH